MREPRSRPGEQANAGITWVHHCGHLDIGGLSLFFVTLTVPQVVFDHFVGTSIHVVRLGGRGHGWLGRRTLDRAHSVVIASVQAGTGQFWLFAGGLMTLLSLET